MAQRTLVSVPAAVALVAAATLVVLYGRMAMSSGASDVPSSADGLKAMAQVDDDGSHDVLRQLYQVCIPQALEQNDLDLMDPCVTPELGAEMAAAPEAAFLLLASSQGQIESTSMARDVSETSGPVEACLVHDGSKHSNIITVNDDGPGGLVTHISPPGPACNVSWAS